MTDLGAQPFGAQSFEPWPDGVDVHVESTIVAAGLAAERGDVVVIVDVLSFSTTVSIAIERGAEVLVYSGDEIEARGGSEVIARELDADIIAKGRIADGARFTLSPDSLSALGPEDRVIFTSLNGAACVAAASNDDQPAPAVLVGSLLNRSAVADAVAASSTTEALRREAGNDARSSPPASTGRRPCQGSQASARATKTCSAPVRSRCAVGARAGPLGRGIRSRCGVRTSSDRHRRCAPWLCRRARTHPPRVRGRRRPRRTARCVHLRADLAEGRPCSHVRRPRQGEGLASCHA